MKIMRIVAALMLLLPLSGLSAETGMRWFDPVGDAVPNIQGRAWNAEIGGCYGRLPARAEKMVRQPVWDLSRNAAGLWIKFYTDAPEITIKYQVAEWLSLWNETTVAKSGLDLYMTDGRGNDHWCAAPMGIDFGQTPADTITFRYTDLVYRRGKGSEFQLFLPLYNSVKWMRIGVPEGCAFLFSERDSQRPIVVYGTSIAQGLSASRPAMAWTNILTRRLGLPVVNLGFSGNALMDAEVYDLLSEIDAQMFILDCMPNMGGIKDEVVARTLAGVAKLRARSDAPVLLVENDGYNYAMTQASTEDDCNSLNAELRKAYDALQRQGVKNIYYLTRQEIGLTPDAQVDGWHATDVGMEEYARAYMQKINEILPALANRSFRYNQK